MLNNPDIQPNAAINRWIAAILLFDFKLTHVPASKHQGPDGLSRRPPLEGEDEEGDDPEDWVDEVLGLGIWVASWMAEAVKVPVRAVEVLGMETRAMSARRRREETTEGRKGDKDSGETSMVQQRIQQDDIDELTKTTSSAERQGDKDSMAEPDDLGHAARDRMAEGEI